MMMRQGSNLWLVGDAQDLPFTSQRSQLSANHLGDSATHTDVHLIEDQGWDTLFPSSDDLN